MARTSPGRRNEGKVAPEPADESAELTDVDAEEEPEAAVDDAAEDADVDRSLWESAAIDPVEIALPSGVGYTLRAYRLDTELTPTDISEREDEDLFAGRADEDEDEDEVGVIVDDEFLAGVAEDEAERAKEEKAAKKVKGRKRDADEDEETDEADVDEEDEEEDEDEDAAAAEEVPVFLSHRGKLLLFRTPEGLVSYIRSGGPNDLAQLDSWTEVADGISPELVQPTDEDSYELDLVVENLRGGHDAWDTTLLIEAGEISRDLAHALRLVPVMDALAPGSPLDDLDEALRSAAGGGLGGFRGRRRLKKIGAQTATLGWRTIIGKISAAVDWRD